MRGCSAACDVLRSAVRVAISRSVRSDRGRVSGAGVDMASRWGVGGGQGGVARPLFAFDHDSVPSSRQEPQCAYPSTSAVIVKVRRVPLVRSWHSQR